MPADDEVYAFISSLVDGLLCAIEKKLWRKETLRLYLLISISSLFMISYSKLPQLLTATGAIYATHDPIYYTTLNTIVCLALYAMSIFVKRWLLGLREEETSHIQHTLRCSIIECLSILHMVVNTASDTHAMRDSARLFTIYIPLSVGVSIIMNRCHTVCLQVIGDDPDKKTELFGPLLKMGGCLLCLAIWCAYDSFQCYRTSEERGQIFYIHFTIQFLVLIIDLIYTLQWCKLSLEESRSNIPGRNRVGMKSRDIFQLARLDSMFAWLLVKWFFFICIIVSMQIENQKHVLYGRFLILLKMAMGVGVHIPDDGTMLGYTLLRDFKLDGVRLGELRDPTCIFCLDDMVHNEKNENAQFEEVDAVKLRCGHAFHFGCIMTWMKSRKGCPICSRSVFKHAGETASGIN